MIATLRMQHIRSYSDGQFEFEPGVTIIVGPNGSGKTSVVESLHYVFAGKSFRGSDEDVLQKGSDWGRIDATLFGGSVRCVKLQYTQDRLVRTFQLDGSDKKRLSTSLLLPVVLFQPQDMTILTGEPQARRDLLDGVLQKTLPHYTQHLKNYKRVLQQRNALLKADRIVKKDELFVWNVRLSEFGGFVHAARAAYIAKISDSIQEIYNTITPKTDTITANYLCDINSSDYTASMLKQLELRYEKDTQRGFTSVGPHRDDLLLTINGQDVRTAASRGEARSLLLALKTVELREQEVYFGVKPLVLLDDVFSELDGARRQALATMLAPYQTIITTTDADLVVEHFSGKAYVIAL